MVRVFILFRRQRREIGIFGKEDRRVRDRPCSQKSVTRLEAVFSVI